MPLAALPIAVGLCGSVCALSCDLGWSLRVRRPWCLYRNCLDQNTLPNTGGDWEALLRTLADVLMENEQRHVAGGVSELLMHE
jgi:hypothetical protein